MKAVNPELTLSEKTQLKKAGIRVNDIGKYSYLELSDILGLPEVRAKEIRAMVEFQSIPSIGPKFARDLVEMGYYDLASLRNSDGAELLDEHERLIGAWTDPCVEDQFRLVVYYANSPSFKKQWWDFTNERKAYRQQFGYPASRPLKAWQSLEKYKANADKP